MLRGSAIERLAQQPPEGKPLFSIMPFVVISILSTLIVLGIMVLVHEFGHFAMAKLFRVKVEVFSIGFGKRLFGFRRGDTDYRLSLLPLGGYVKMQGELGGDGTVPLETTVLSGTAATGDAPRDSGDLNAKPRWQRVLIALAGPVANFILALVLMTGLYMMHNEVDAYRSKPADIDFVTQNSPAASAGLKAGDRIVHFDSRNNPTWDDVWVRIEVNLGQKVPVTVLRDGERVSTTLAVTSPRNPDDFSIGTLGIVPLMQTTPVVVHAVTPGMPAGKSGLKSGDKMLSLNGMPLHSVSAMLAFLQQNHDAPVTMKVQSGSTVHDLQVTPLLADNSDGGKSYQLGFEAEPPPFKVQKLALAGGDDPVGKVQREELQPDHRSAAPHGDAPHGGAEPERADRYCARDWTGRNLAGMAADHRADDDHQPEPRHLQSAAGSDPGWRRDPAAADRKHAAARSGSEVQGTHLPGSLRAAVAVRGVRDDQRHHQAADPLEGQAVSEPRSGGFGRLHGGKS